MMLRQMKQRIKSYKKLELCTIVHSSFLIEFFRIIICQLIFMRRKLLFNSKNYFIPKMQIKTNRR